MNPIYIINKTDYEVFVRCHDCDHPISNHKVPRGKRGIAIIWPKLIDKYIKRLEDGNNRIMTIKIQSTSKTICLVNTYLPTQMSNSVSEYRECLDIIQTIIEKYGLTQEMVLCGDMNGILIYDRSNAHDCKLKNFVKENKLIHSDALSTQPTFFHHNGKSTSQDYILSSGSFINKTNILRQHATNTSTHVPVVAELCRCLSTSIQKSRIKESRYKILWDKADQNQYQEILKLLLSSYVEAGPESDVDTIITNLTEILHVQVAAEKSVLTEIIKLNGFKWKASPTLKKLIGISKNKHRLWDKAGRPRNNHPLFCEKKETKRILRKQQRKETAIEKQNFLRNLENNLYQNTFFKLLRRNQATATSNGPEVLFKGTKSANTCDEQRELSAEHFQELATPQNAPDYSELLNNCERRCQLVCKLHN